MKINGYEYTEQEVLDALRQKGYLIMDAEIEVEEDAFMGGKETVKVKCRCALKGAELPEEKNTWQNVAIREFQKFTKPKLI